MTRSELEMLVRRHQAEIFRYLRYMGATAPEVAEDLVQETFLAAFSAKNVPDDLENERRLAGWLRGIARNVFLMHCRRVRTDRRKVRVDTSVVEAAEDFWVEGFLGEGDGFEAVEALRGCLTKLSPRGRSAIQMRYAEERSRDAMAEALGMTADGVKSLLRRIRAHLADCIRARVAGAGI